MSVEIHVSLGEALDKLSILEIKKDNINDSRRGDIITELDYLHNKLEIYRQKYKYLYSILYKTNLRIWDCMDIIRERPSHEVYEYIDETIQLNDSRYLIKKKLNEISNSQLKEQKGYKLRVLNILFGCNTRESTIYILNGAIRYYSFFYDVIELISKSSECEIHLRRIFDDDPFIKVSLFSPCNADSIANTDSISIDDTEISVNITHSFFTKKYRSAEGNDNNKYSAQIKDIYNKLGVRVNIFDEYRN